MEDSAQQREVDADFLALLVCPLTREALRAATAEELATLHLEAALVRVDGRVAYPVSDGIPILLPDAAIPLG